VILLVGAASATRRDAASHNLAEERALTGLSLLQEGRLDEAEAAYRSAIAADESSSFAWDGLGLVLLRREMRSDARNAFEQAVQLNPSNATAWVHLGVAFEFLNNPSGALNAYRQALAITPQRAEAIEMYERARRRYGR
jgi:Tfp pilus assembly protein PilF